MIKKRKKLSWNLLNSFLNTNFKYSLQYIKKTRNYILFSFLVFLIFSIIGFSFPIFFRQEIIKIIAELIKKTEGLGIFGLISFIIVNNIQSAFFGMVFGVFFGIFSFFVLLINGYILGFIASETVKLKSGFILWRLFPHGIFEIPAIMIALGIGLRMGSFLFVKHKDRKKEFIDLIYSSLKAFIFVVIPLLVIAGIIEGVLICLLS